MQILLQVINKYINQFISSSGKICGVHAQQFSIWPDIWSLKENQTALIVSSTLLWELGTSVFVTFQCCWFNLYKWAQELRLEQYKKSTKAFQMHQTATSFQTLAHERPLKLLNSVSVFSPQVTAEQLLKHGIALWKTEGRKGKKSILSNFAYRYEDKGRCWSSLVL